MACRWSGLRSASEPRWEAGLCGITLLPLEELEELHVVPWLEERPCLVLSTFFHYAHGKHLPWVPLLFRHLMSVRKRDIYF